MIGQELYDSTKAYQSWSRRWRQNGAQPTGLKAETLRREWYEIVNRLSRASQAAIEAAKEGA